MTKTIEDLFLFGVFVADLFVIIQILFFLKPPKKFKVIWLVFSMCVLNSLFNLLPSFIPSKILYFNFAIFTIIEYSIFASIFYRIIKNRRFQKIIIILSFIF